MKTALSAQSDPVFAELEEIVRNLRSGAWERPVFESQSYRRFSSKMPKVDGHIVEM